MNSKVRSFLKVLSINIAVLGILLVSPALLLRSYKIAKTKFTQSVNSTTDSRAFYPTYENKDFSIELYNEFSKIPKRYKSFLGWRREKVNFNYTNISGPYHARKSTGEAIDNSVWFFGGSTMWGTGASDSQTIPSHFNSITTLPVYNFGESGWTSRQSLNQLINVLGDNHQPTSVIFYDGVNDVIHQCRSEYQSLPVHVREARIQNSLTLVSKLQSIKNRGFKFVTSPYIALAKKFKFKPLLTGSSKQFFDCDTNRAKSQSIAEHLVNNWRTAFAISRSNGFEFYGILQPTLFSTSTNSEYLVANAMRSHYETQFNAVYPLIVKEIKRHCDLDEKFCASLIIGTDWLDGINNIFTDFCHVNSLGNKVIAENIAPLLKNS